LESTGSNGRGVERRVPEMSRMVEFNCTSTRLVWAELQTGAQYSAAGKSDNNSEPKFLQNGENKWIKMFDVL